jgi:hypothetical protein
MGVQVPLLAPENLILVNWLGVSSEGGVRAPLAKIFRLLAKTSSMADVAGARTAAK